MNPTTGHAAEIDLQAAYTRLAPSLFRYALMILTNHHEAEDAVQQVFSALRALPPEQREVIHLKVFEGHTFNEIADLTGESINTAASRYRYAMDKLRAMLGAERPS
jgi:DNA-directed RNA polymerase specialized sigma24 family protein